MDQTLLSPSEVLSQTWHEGKKYLAKDVRESIGFLALALISFALAILSFYVPDAVRLVIRGLDIVLIQIIGSTWVTLRLASTILAERQGKKKPRHTLQMLSSFLLISILSGLAAAGGTLLFVIPGIWLTGALAFAGYTFLDEGRTGRQALARSMELVKGRWWSMILRIAVPGILILFVSLVAASIIEALVGFIAGYRPSELIGQVGFLNVAVLKPVSMQIATTAVQVINALSMLIALPFLTHLMTTIYLDLKRHVVRERRDTVTT